MKCVEAGFLAAPKKIPRTGTGNVIQHVVHITSAGRNPKIGILGKRFHIQRWRRIQLMMNDKRFIWEIRGRKYRIDDGARRSLCFMNLSAHPRYLEVRSWWISRFFSYLHGLARRDGPSLPLLRKAFVEIPLTYFWAAVPGRVQ